MPRGVSENSQSFSKTCSRLESTARLWKGSSRFADSEAGDEVNRLSHWPLQFLPVCCRSSSIVLTEKCCIDFCCSCRFLCSACFTACDRARRLAALSLVLSGV